MVGAGRGQEGEGTEQRDYGRGGSGSNDACQILFAASHPTFLHRLAKPLVQVRGDPLQGRRVTERKGDLNPFPL